MTDNRQLYQIRVEGQLDRCWDAWFTGMNLTYQRSDGVQTNQINQTILTGYVLNQRALYTMLNKIYDLNLPLVAVIRLPGVGQVSQDTATLQQMRAGTD